MKRILGKIVLLWAVTAMTLFAAAVTARLDKNEIFRGDTVNLTITAEGDQVKFPVITKIGGAPVLGTSDAQHTTIINGNVSHSVSRTYTFAPQKTTKIPPFSVDVDGKVFKTDPLTVKVVKPTASKAGAPYVLELKLDKKRVHVGESVRLDLKFKQKRGVKADKVEITPPKLENFWVKEISGAKTSIEGDYIVKTYSYLLFPQKPGDYTIPSVVADVGVRVKRQSGFGGAFDDPFFNDPFFNSFVTSIEWKKVFSNEAKLHVDPLPGNLEVYGHFTIKADVDKKEVAAGKPVNLTITIEGEGNIDDIQKFDLDIPDAVVYADEPKITSRLENGKYVGTFTQKIAIVADHDYTIPPISFTWFDSKTQKRVTKKSAPIHIKVKGGGAKATASKPTVLASKSLEKELHEAASSQSSTSETSGKQEAEVSPAEKYLWMAAGAVLGSLLTWFVLTWQRHPKRTSHPKTLSSRIRRAKEDKELYNLLLPYAKEGELIETALRELEENLYKNAAHKIDREKLAAYFEEVLGL